MNFGVWADGEEDGEGDMVDKNGEWKIASSR
jgi:hypothetical protein